MNCYFRGAKKSAGQKDPPLQRFFWTAQCDAVLAFLRKATVLRRALRFIPAELGSGPGRLLTTARGKFAAPLAKASDEAIEHRFVRALRFVACSLPGHGGLAGEDELRDVGQSDGVTAGDALASELPDEIAEEEIDLIGGGETVDVGEKLGGEDFGVDDWDTRFETIGVIGAERGAVYAVRRATVLVD